jgi:hypothetical protein
LFKLFKVAERDIKNFNGKLQHNNCITLSSPYQS